MKTSILFLAVFGATLLFGNLQVEWQSWFYGLATGVSVAQIAFALLED